MMDEFLHAFEEESSGKDRSTIIWINEPFGGIVQVVQGNMNRLDFVNITNNMMKVVYLPLG